MGPEILAIAKVLISAYFSFVRLNGATEEEIDQIYKEEKEKFQNNTPDKLEDV